MMERLFNHPTWLKLFSLLLAVLLWRYVMPTYMTEQSKIVEVRLNVMKNKNPDLVWLEEDSQPDTVKVSLSGRAYLLNGITKDDFKATLDLNEVTSTGKTVALGVDLEPVDISQTQFENLSPSLTPKTVSVTLVEIKTATVPVTVTNRFGQISYQGSDWQYAATPATPKVAFTGRDDVLGQVTGGVITLDTAKLTPDVISLTATALPVDNAGKPVKLNSTEVNLKIDWRKLPPGRNFKVQPMTTGTLPPGYMLGTLEPDVPNAFLRADTVDGQLPDQDFVLTMPIDLTGHDKTFTVPVKLAPPPGSVVEPSDLVVNVKVNIQELSTEKVFKGVPLGTQGGPANAKLTLSVTDVQVRVQGPFSVVNKIDPASLRAYVDLESITPGKHTLPVTVVLPPGAIAAVADPAVVDVTLAGDTAPGTAPAAP